MTSSAPAWFRCRLIAVVLCCLPASHAGASDRPDWLPVSSHIGGRVTDAGEAHGRRHQWPGTYVEARFRGDALRIDMLDAKQRYRLTIDGTERQIIDASSGPELILKALGPGDHQIRIEKISEALDGDARLPTISVEAPGRALPPPRHDRQIEFIGDSYTVGYGNRLVQDSCTDAQVFLATNTSAAFAPKVAKYFAADYQIIAASGRGVVRNYADFAHGQPLPSLYPFALIGNGPRYDNPAWRPQLIVIGLGTNDFSTAIAANETWRDRAALRREFIDSYVDFIGLLRQRQPQAAMILMASDRFDGEIITAVHKVARRLRAQGQPRISVLTMKGLSYRGCNGHPDVGDHQMIADSLVRHIEAGPGFSGWR
jgi:lysophospholipase L1-like esterase